jgi:hypothetical protein
LRIHVVYENFFEGVAIMNLQADAEIFKFLEHRGVRYQYRPSWRDRVQQKDVAHVEALLRFYPGAVLSHNKKNAGHTYDLIALHSAVDQCDLVPLDKREGLGDEFSDRDQISLLQLARFRLRFCRGRCVD